MTFDELNRISNNPSRVIATIFNNIESTFNAQQGTLNSSDHPFAFMVDLVTGTQYGFISRLGDAEASQFRVHARNIGDLSKTMSDEDWYGVYGTPSGTTIRFIIAEETLDEIAIRYTETSGTLENSYRKLVIPPDTQFDIAGIPFLLENPVEIRVMDHGGYEVVYDSTRQSKLNPLSTNTPDVTYLDIDRLRYLAIHLPVRQLEITAYPNKPINGTAGFKDVITYSDDIYAVRAFITPDGSTRRSEMAVIYNNENYDPNQATLVVDLKTDTTFEVSVPPVYTQNGLITSARITILVYTTKGEMYRDLSTLTNQYFKYAFYDYGNDNGSLNQFEKPLATVNTLLVDVLDPITGGQSAMEFQALKDMLIYGHRQRLIPISNNDISQFLLTNGYSSVKSIDMITDRLYRVTKNLPVQASKLYTDSSVASFNSAMGVNVASILTSLEELIASGWGLDNGLRVTLPQRSVIDITQQTPFLVPKSQYQTLKDSTNQNKIDTMAKRTMVYTPFAYVFDTTKNRAVTRIYRLNHPTIRYQTFRFENASLGLQVSVGNIGIEHTDDGYRITIQTSSTDAYQKLSNDVVGLQLSFTPSGVASPITMRAKLAGVTEDKERRFVFDIPSKFDITDADLIGVTGFNQFGQPASTSFVDLQTTATFIFTLGGSGLTLTSASDMKVDQTLFSGTNISIIETDYVVQFGRNMGSLYTRIRPMVGDAQYKKYEADVPELYEKDVYQYQTVTGPDGTTIRKLVLVDGLPVIEHSAGTQVMDSSGNPVWRFLKGQTVFDDQNQPVLLEPRKMKYYWDFIGFDFSYILSQDQYDTDYMESTEAFFVDQVVAQLDNFNTIVLDETKLVFKPRSTMGYTRTIVNEMIERTLKNDLTFSVVYMLTQNGMRNQNLKDNLNTSTHTVINNMLLKDTVSHSGIVSALKDNGGSEIIDIHLTVSAGGYEIDAITNVDTTNGFSVAKNIEQTADKFLTIKEAIEIQFKRHLPESM
jgi:hypothetical protein